MIDPGLILTAPRLRVGPETDQAGTERRRPVAETPEGCIVGGTATPGDSIVRTGQRLHRIARDAT
jgi:hypothetical protein